ncbi:MAG: hypothetical protein AAGB18_00540 [Pseudomonadota bacterium]
MPGTPKALVAAAKQKFAGRTGPMCHDAVLEWMQDAGYVETDRHKSLFTLGKDRSSVFAKILVSEADPRIMTMKTLNELPEGTIIGFWKDKKLMHSIITLGNRMLAGANNAGIFTADTKVNLPKIYENLRSLFLTSQIGWNEEDSTVGLDRYKMHFQAAPEIAKRIAAGA